MLYLCQSIIKIFLLLGLRVSQFNGEKCSATSDPAQKTITNFITLGDVNRNCSSLPDAAEHSNAETDLSIDSAQTNQLDWRDPFDGNHLSDVDYQSCTVRRNDYVEQVCLLLSLPTWFAM